MKNLSVTLIAVLFICLANLSAQNYAIKNTWELGGRINYTSTTTVRDGETSDNSVNLFKLYTPFYYFVIDGLALGIIPGYENLSSGDLSVSFFKILGGVAYNIKTESIAFPYLEGRAGYNTSSNGESRSGIVWWVGGGVKLQVGGNALINIGLAYEQSTLEISNNEGGRDGTNAWGIDAGLIIFFNN
jgi:hypothetical protein